MTQTKVGWRAYVSTTTASTLWNSIYSVYNADSVGSSSLKTSLFAAYNGESNTNDSFGSNNGTVIGGLTYGDGKIGKGFTLNGSNAFVSLPNNSLNFTGDFSISLWVNFSDNSKGGEYITNLSTGGTYGYGWAFIKNNSKLSFAITTGNAWVEYQYPMDDVNNYWRHIVITRKNSTSTKLYVNGALVTNGTTYAVAGALAYGYSFAPNGPYTAINPTYPGTQICKIGRAGMAATMDAINIWQKELTASEVTELYNSGNGTQYITDSFYKPTTNNALGTNNGTAQGGLTYGVGKVGTAFQFNGSNSVVTLPVNSMNFTGDCSFSFFVNLGTVGSSTQTVFSSENWTGSGGDRGYLINFINGVLYFEGYNNSTFVVRCPSTTTVSANQWYHFTITKTSSQVKMYMNGSLQTTTNYTGVINYNPTVYPAIGALYYQNGTNSYNFISNGSKIDAFNAWNKVLTQSEITELYNSGNGKQYPN
jgi:hypothetical protein